MQIYNTLTREKERFKPKRLDNVKIYSCGPTVYNYAHIWNFRYFIFSDYVIKTIKFVWWFKVNSLMNLTDIDDKTIRDSIKAWETLKDFTKKYSDIFLEDLEKLWIEKADNVVPISEAIEDMVIMINTLLKKWYAYLWEDKSVYFDISKFKNYWKLANLDFSWMKSSVRIDNDEYDKENASDFALWKSYKDEDKDNFWEETFVLESWEEVVLKGRPGWHIECSALNSKYFGAEIDIHMWGEDLVFPHHQNEIAQSEACHWKQYARYWIHSGHLMVDWKKMSKSAWNFYTMADIEEKYKDEDKDILYRALRFLFVNWKYSQQIDFTFDKLDSCIKTVKNVDETCFRLANYLETAKDEIDVTIQKAWNLKVKWIRRDFRELQQDFIGEFYIYLEDDFNTPQAFSVFFEYLKVINKEIDGGILNLQEAKSMKDMVLTMNYVLWIIWKDSFEINEIPEEINKKAEDRLLAKKDKNYELADEIREEVLSLGYEIIDKKDDFIVKKV